jgi:hypothetical protein
MALSAISMTPGSGLDIAAHEIVEDSDTKLIERTAMGAGILELPATPQISEVDSTGLFPLSAVGCQGAGFIVGKTTFSANNVTVTIFIVFFDANDEVIGYFGSSGGLPITINNTAISDGASRFYGDTFVVQNQVGAQSVKIYLASVPTNSGDVSISLAYV